MKKTIYTMWKRCGEKYAELPAVRWLAKKDVLERSYAELGADVTGIRKGFNALGFSHKHIVLVGTSSVEWITAYMSIVTSNNTAVPLDAALPAADLIDLINRSDSEGVFLDPKFVSLAEPIRTNCPAVRKIWMLSGDAVDGTDTLSGLIACGSG